MPDTKSDQNEIILSGIIVRKTGGVIDNGIDGKDYIVEIELTENTAHLSTIEIEVLLNGHFANFGTDSPGSFYCAGVTVYSSRYRESNFLGMISYRCDN